MPTRFQDCFRFLDFADVAHVARISHILYLNDDALAIGQLQQKIWCVITLCGVDAYSRASSDFELFAGGIKRAAMHINREGLWLKCYDPWIEVCELRNRSFVRRLCSNNSAGFPAIIENSLATTDSPERPISLNDITWCR
ncbi:hypothetical protein CEW87_05535 [Parazoarcus communis]|uniref:Uncharacterized protein n=1 Tax=Parazoarcus communis TaxID=41977 RepID=A0A2U8H2E3_9RHOO|nr:hypothetical protein CEW87_05535 [Parazoarcus communis]